MELFLVRENCVGILYVKSDKVQLLGATQFKAAETESAQCLSASM